ncbi:MAG: hypothetical protein AVDCRST_MAG51-1845 [uncultured Ramlibacter sp.]|uniref:Uncharacterized protein n=1 Tax=uncultured Ramlibacter sp. TaxID=260755 RepID=A0A6J4PKI7_9BURK|nr:MAG: hypothetical protein AVDCRST_MAG51-1845 [uncultured Ramlibacter sp.]
MRWFKPNLRSSIHAIFSGGNTVPPSSITEDAISIEDIRCTMLHLAVVEGDERAPIVSRRIRFAADIEALWFLRGELMALLAKAHGEAAALERLHELSDMFADLLPAGLRSRPSPLSSNNRD